MSTTDAVTNQEGSRPLVLLPPTARITLCSRAERLRACCYTAGILDGEGWIGAYTAPDRKAPAVRVTVASTSPVLIAWLREWWGGQTASRGQPNAKCKTVYNWRVSSRHAAGVLWLCRPHLVIKREQANVALAIRLLTGRQGGNDRTGTPDSRLSEMKSLSDRLHVLNRRGVAVG